MIIEKEDIQLKQNVNENEKVRFKASESGVVRLIEIASKDMYEYPLRSVMTEFVQNALDAHKAAEKEDVPITVELPTTLDPTYRVVDEGIGMSEEEITTIFSSVGESTKDGTNDYIGAFGLGKLVFAAYSGTMNLISHYQGKKYIYFCRLQNGEGEIIKIAEEPTIKDNGLTVEIPIKSDDISKCQNFAHELYGFIKPQPKILNLDVSLKTGEDTFYCEDSGVSLDMCKNSDSGSAASICTVGSLPVMLNYRNIKDILDENTEDLIYCRFPDMVFHFGVGEVDLASSRDKLRYTEKTKAAFERKVNYLTQNNILYDAFEKFCVDREIPILKIFNYLQKFDDCFVKKLFESNKVQNYDENNDVFFANKIHLNYFAEACNDILNSSSRHIVTGTRKRKNFITHRCINLSFIFGIYNILYNKNKDFEINNLNYNLSLKSKVKNKSLSSAKTYKTSTKDINNTIPLHDPQRGVFAFPNIQYDNCRYRCFATDTLIVFADANKKYSDLSSIYSNIWQFTSKEYFLIVKTIPEIKNVIIKALELENCDNVCDIEQFCNKTDVKTKKQRKQRNQKSSRFALYELNVYTLLDRHSNLFRSVDSVDRPQYWNKVNLNKTLNNSTEKTINIHHPIKNYLPLDPNSVIGNQKNDNLNWELIEKNISSYISRNYNKDEAYTAKAINNYCSNATMYNDLCKLSQLDENIHIYGSSDSDNFKQFGFLNYEQGVIKIIDELEKDKNFLNAFALFSKINILHFKNLRVYPYGGAKNSYIIDSPLLRNLNQCEIIHQRNLELLVLYSYISKLEKKDIIKDLYPAHDLIEKLNYWLKYFRNKGVQFYKLDILLEYLTSRSIACKSISDKLNKFLDIDKLKPEVKSLIKDLDAQHDSVIKKTIQETLPDNYYLLPNGLDPVDCFFIDQCNNTLKVFFDLEGDGGPISVDKFFGANDKPDNRRNRFYVDLLDIQGSVKKEEQDTYDFLIKNYVKETTFAKQNQKT